MWREPTIHSNDCYFCLTPPIQCGISRKKKRSVVYLDVASVSRPVPHGIDLSVPRYPEGYQQSSEEEINSMEVDYKEPTTSQSSQFVGDNIAGCGSEPYFPFLGAHAAPAGYRGDADGEHAGTVRACCVCYTLLRQQWEQYDRENKPHSQRFYWMKRLDGKPFIGNIDTPL
ncbi:hypothetical protein EVAR_42671_1 [Eumeta japonica]|uniref:Uncharacterized protein n=1 Tax=Eumeta variegata TaxID=151549 RepID=A0A4C1X280_EUMVA|nr:hypothetical protein EVAR_42671_1 [Eumeta japonica]